MNEFICKIVEIMAKEVHFDKRQIREDTLLDDINLDSLAFSEVIIAIEAELKKQIDVVGLSDSITEDTRVLALAEDLYSRLS